MNFRTLTSFWRRGGGGGTAAAAAAEDKNNAVRECDGNSLSLLSGNSRRKKMQLHHLHKQRTMSSMERTQAALLYVQHIVESKRSICVSSSISVESDSPRCCAATSSPALHPAGEAILPLEQEREEVIAALDICLFGILEPASDGSIAGNGGGCSSNKCSNSNTRRNSVDKEVVGAAAYNCNERRETEAEAEAAAGGGGGGTAHASPSVEDGTVTSVATTATVTHERWRWFLLQLVNVLIDIDNCVYVDMMVRSRQSRPVSNLLASPLLSPGKTPLSRPANSPMGLTLDGLDVTGHSASQGAAVASVATKGRRASASLNAISESFIDIELNQLRRTEEQQSVVMALVTWIILRAILRHQLGRQAPRNLSEASPVADTPLSAAEPQTTCAIPVPWEEVVVDLMGLFGATQEMTVEVFVSFWILRDHAGHELVQCALQNSRCESGDIRGATPNNSTPFTGGTDAPKAADSLPPLNTAAAAEHASVENAFIDDIVEQVEILYKEHVVLTWVAYLEKRYSFMFEQGENREESLSSSKLYNSLMMFTYTICSPHWGEEKQQEAFSQLQRLFDENSKLAESSDTKIAASRVSTRCCRPPSPAVSDHCGVDSDFSAVCSSDSAAALPESNPQKVPHMVQSLLERQENVSEVENESAHSLSVGSLADGTTECVKMATREMIRVSLEEDLVPLMHQASWMSALHLRVKQCLGGNTLRLEEAQRCACEERRAALGTLSFSYKQASLKSFVKTYIAIGRYSAALKVAHLHFVNAKKNWLAGNQCQSNGVSYLMSMGLLSQAQKACGKDALVLETAQFALPQVALCEEVINDLSPPTCGACTVRYADSRRRIYRAKLLHLRESWRAHHSLHNTLHATRYFEQFMEHIKCRRCSRREFEAYAALKERGEQLIEEKQYGSAVMVLKQAVEHAKSLNMAIRVPSTTTTTAAGSVAPIHDAVSPVLSSNTTGVISNAVDAGAYGSRATECELELIRCEAESERNLALAYVTQADHEVNVRERRQQLSHAVNSAYAAQNALHRWTLRANSPSRGMMMVDMAFCLVVTAKALLRLGQPKKAALLLEPLVEDKANSASVRPPLWSNVLLLPPLGQPFTRAEMMEHMQTLQVKIATYEVHTQCLSKFCGERAYRETMRAREFLQEVKTWTALFCGCQEKDVKSDGDAASAGGSPSAITPAAVNIAVCASLREVNALQPILSITAGDSLSALGRWEEALQEYSNALAMYAMDGKEDCGRSGKGGGGLMGSAEERTPSDGRMGESLVLAKLAELYTTLEKPRTAIQYYRQVLEYASEMGDALLQYNAYIRLARLYTAAGDSVEAGKQWEKVSELAKEYEDQEISRETTRNIVAAQRAARAYRSVLDTAKELDVLASAAEGVDAAADKRFALEALADAHLQLGQYKECITALNERETVQDKFGQLNGTLIKMRARALLGDGAAQDAIKVLTSWAHEARLLSNMVEVGHANTLLALAHATMHQTFKARRHHQVALRAFSDVSEMCPESCSAVIESARWLVHQFYLNDEKVPLCDCNNGWDKVSRSVSNKVTATNPGGLPSNGGGLHKNEPVGDDGGGGGGGGNVHESCVPTASGDLSVLMREEEERIKKGNTKAYSRIEDKESAREDDGELYTDDHKGKEVLSNSSMFGMGRMSVTVGCSKDDEEMGNEREDESSRSSTGSGSGRGASNSASKKSTLKHLSSDPDLVLDQSIAQTPMTRRASVPSSRGLSISLANVSLCKHPAVLEGDNVVPPDPPSAETLDVSEAPPARNTTRVRTHCFRRALETMETTAQLSLMPPAMRQELVPRSPADAVDLALLAFPNCTFVFYFAEFATQYGVVVRPANRFFFIKRSVQAYVLNEYHAKKTPPPAAVTGPTATPVITPTGLSVGQTSVTLTEKPISMIPSSLNPISGKGHVTSTEMPHAPAAAAIHSDTVQDELLSSLQDLHADLWGPIRDSLQLSRCSTDEAECLVFVVDPTLLHVPFPALHDPTAVSDPLGQQSMVVVTPTVTQFLCSMRCDKEPSLLNAPKQDRCIFLPETVTETASAGVCGATVAKSPSFSSSSPGNTRSDLGSRKTAVSGTKDMLLPTAEDPKQVASLAATAPWFTSTSHSWTAFTGCTRKELISALELPNCRVLMLLCDPVEHMFKVADGMVRLVDMTRDHPSLPKSLDLVVVTNDRATAPSASEPGVAVRLCLHHGCKRVLRVDLPHSKGITPAHQQLLSVYFEKLTVALEWRMRYPYALALRMAQEEALRCGMEPVVWASLTLVGAA